MDAETPPIEPGIFPENAFAVRAGDQLIRLSPDGIDEPLSAAIIAAQETGAILLTLPVSESGQADLLAILTPKNDDLPF